ncbi:MAG TPA: phage/plasmid primase, P4 family, partial [Candidatus Acidoferrum sp.]|nr:phage/plasmid primase, P4 family [Candidatus Acidoferrum sp.]
KQTSEKKSRGEPTTGMTRLVELLGLPPECVKTFHQWLQTKPEPEAPSSDAKEDAVVLDPRSPRENAREFIKRCFTIDNDRTLVHHQDEYFVYERGRYRPIELTAIHSKLYEFTETSFFKSGDKLEPFRPKQQNITTIEHALRSLVLVEKNVLQPPCWISGIGPRPTDLVVCQNGIFDLATGELMPHTPRLFTFNALNIDYDPAAPSPERWLQFLDEVFPDDEESIRTLQEIFGYLLTPETRQQKAFMMVAPPRSGKGTIARVIEQLVGKPNFAGIHLASLGETFGLQPLIGKLVAVVTDARLGSKSDKAALVEKILSISGEDAVQINRKYIPQWEGRLATRFFIHTNEVPNLPDASGAFVNRFIVLTTASSFLGREDHALGERLMTELPGILRWAIEGWRRLRERGRFLQPASAAELIEMFAKVSSPVKSFVDEWCHLGPDLRCDKERLYEEWVKWSNTQGRGSFLSKDQFCAKLYAAFPEVKPGKGSRSEGRPPELRGICPNIDYWEPHQVKIPF